MKIEFSTDSAAFSEGMDDGEVNVYEIAEVVRDVARKIDRNATSGTIRDRNGNTIGSWSL